MAGYRWLYSRLKLPAGVNDVKKQGEHRLGAIDVQRNGSAIIALIALLSVVTHISWRHGQTGARPSVVSSESHFARRPGFEALILETVVDIPEGSMLLLGSLDQYARSHEVEIEVLTKQQLDFNHTSTASAASATFKSAPLTAGRSCWWDRFQNSSGSLPQQMPLTVERQQRIPAQRRFLVPTFQSDLQATTRPTIAKRVAVGKTCVVYVDQSSELGFSAEDGDRIVRLMDAGLLTFVESQVRPIVDLDSNRCITFCITALASGHSSGQFVEPVHGCVRAEDFCVAEGPLNPLAGDIVYLDPKLPPGGDLAALLAHELTHAAIYSAFVDEFSTSGHDSTTDRIRAISLSKKVSAPVEQPTVPAWLNEGLAHVVERRAYPRSHNLLGRFQAFRKSPHRTPLVIPDFQSRRFRRGASRAAACSFLEFHLGTRSPLLPNQNQPPNSISCLEELCGEKFDDLFQQWTTSLVGEIRECPLLPSSNVTLMGTSVCHFQKSTDACRVRVRAPAECECQITVVDAKDRRVAHSTVLRESDDQRDRRFSTAGHSRVIR